jgi:hypothetical protein
MHIKEFFFRVGWIFSKNSSLFLSKEISTGSSINAQLVKNSLISSALMIQENLVTAQIYKSRPELYELVYSELKTLPDGLNLEFGVSVGGSLRLFANKLGFIYGFDSFLGLEQPWSSLLARKGAFDLGGEIPKSAQNIPNTKLVVGRVEETLSNFLQNNSTKISFAHMDLDLYSPTKFVLEQIKPRLQSGSLILFDEFHGYPGWQNHEWKAFNEVFSASEFIYLGFSEQQCLVKII